MSNAAFDSLKLGGDVYEACPWENCVRHRIIESEFVHRSMRGGDVTESRTFSVNGSIVSDNRVLPGDWGTRWFSDIREARRVCAEQSLRLKAERRAQIEKEMEQLQKQLAEEKDE